jgi:hypothetical protein
MGGCEPEWYKGGCGIEVAFKALLEHLKHLAIAKGCE